MKTSSLARAYARVGSRTPRSAALLLTLGAVALAGCGSSSSSSSAASSGGASTAAGAPASSSGGSSVSAGNLAAAKAVVAGLSKKPSSITVDAPLTKKPPAGTVLVNLYQPNPSQILNAQAFTQAGKALGYTVKNISVGTTSDDLQSAFSAAVQDKPAGVWVNAIQPSLWSTFAATFKKDHIPVVNQGANWPNGGDDFNWLVPANVVKLFQPLGDWVVADANGSNVNVLIPYLQGVTVYQTATDGIKARIMKLDPDAKVYELPISASDAGTSGPNEIVGYVQQHPDIKYVVFPLASIETGVVAALKTAGLSPKVVVFAGAQAQQAELKQGEISVDLALDQTAQAYAVVDFLTRAITRQNTAPATSWKQPTQFLTSSGINNPNTPYAAGPVSEWTKIWGGAKTVNVTSGQ